MWLYYLQAHALTLVLIKAIAPGLESRNLNDVDFNLSLWLDVTDPGPKPRRI